MYDAEFAAKGQVYNEVLANQRSFVQTRGEYQALRANAMNGLYTGSYYGGLLGIGRAIQMRNLKVIPVTSAACGVAYAGYLCSSLWFRMDI